MSGNYNLTESQEGQPGVVAQACNPSYFESGDQ
jgi:hypothetical protein